MRRALLLAPALLALAAFAVPSSGAAKPKKQPPPKPAPTVPTTVIDETKDDPKAPTAAAAAATEQVKAAKPPRPNIELSMCPSADLAELEAAKLLKLLRGCKKLTPNKEAKPAADDDDSGKPRKGSKSKSSKSQQDDDAEPNGGKDPPPAMLLDEAQMLVAICTQKNPDSHKDEPIEATACGLKATIRVEGSTKALTFGADGDYAVALRNAKIARDTKPPNGARFEVTASATPDDGETRTVTSTLLYYSALEFYSNGKFIWLPLPMFTSDFSKSREGYRVGFSPIAIAAGFKWFPSASSTGYLGVSPFVAWNLLIPNDTQTLSNGTFVRVNYKAVGAGLLFDASGWFAFGVGIGKTFTSDDRTDFRTWLYFGPRLLAGLNEF